MNCSPSRSRLIAVAKTDSLNWLIRRDTFRLRTTTRSPARFASNKANRQWTPACWIALAGSMLSTQSRNCLRMREQCSLMEFSGIYRILAFVRRNQHHPHHTLARLMTKNSQTLRWTPGAAAAVTMHSH